MKDGQILWALRSQFSKGDTNAAYDFLVAISDASEGILTPYNPDAKLRGAINRHAVTCYLDSTLFSMFSRLDSFEAMLYNSFGDTPRERLAFLLRLWVNLLRSGNLISTDITKEVQDSLAECGWDDAKQIHQQDASEAFTFITEKLNLPLLTLKMDIYHTGKQDTDDHKFINERLLEVAIPTLPNGEHPAEVKLEDCLEEYFNNRIEVKRYLERRSTLTSMRSHDSKSKGGNSVHVETVEIDPEASTPMTQSSSMPSYLAERPVSRHRAPSIIQERYIYEKDEKLGDSPMDDPKTPIGRLRTGSVRKEVLMPAWQFFSLIPWYTDHTPSSDAQVAAHFSSKRPVLGLCLKRYSYTDTGRAIRLNTYIDIPIEIGLPHFIHDDKIDDDGPLYGNFKLSLQSVVCHRGISVDSGHYISLVRSTFPARNSEQEETSHWLRFDDLANPRISLIDIHKALKEETPYLLFYQILPVEGDPGNLTSGEKSAPPSYSTSKSDIATTVTDTTSSGPLESLIAISSTDSQPDTRSSRPSSDNPDTRGRSSEAVRRSSAISFSDQLPQPDRSSLDLNREQHASAGVGTSDHRKTGSFNNGLTKTFSILGLRDRRKSKEDVTVSTAPIAQQQQQQTQLTPADPHVEERNPEIHVDEVVNMTSEQTSVPTHVTVAATDPVKNKPEPSTFATAVSSTSGSGGLGRSRSKREKSRSRLLKLSAKDKDKDPDRECIVM